MTPDDEPVMSIHVSKENLNTFTQEMKTVVYEVLTSIHTKALTNNTSDTPKSDTPEKTDEKVDETKREKKKEEVTLETDITTYLGIENFKDVKSIEEEIHNNSKRQITAYHLNEFIHSDRFVIHEQNNFYHSEWAKGPRGERWSKLKLNKELIFDVPWEMSLHLEDKEQDFKFVLRLEFANWRDPQYVIYSSKENLPKARKFYNDFQVEYTTKNILKNKNLTFVVTPEGVAPVLMNPCDIDEDLIFISPENSKEIETNIFNLFLKSDLYKENHLPLKRGLIFSGPPGCGKTITIKKVIKNLNEKVTILSVTPKSVSHSSTISSIFEFAKELAPSVVIFEDIDALGESRETGSFSSYVGELLSQLDGLEKMENMVVIATTNYPERLDSALSNRPSRFDRHLKFDLPVDELKLKILNNELKHAEKDSSFDIATFKEDLKHMSGALIKEVAVTTILNAIESNELKPVVTTDHMTEAIKKNQRELYFE